MLLVVGLGLCLITAAEAAPSAPLVCLAVKGDELSPAKAPLPTLVATGVVTGVIVPEPLPSASLDPVLAAPRPSSALLREVVPRAPPAQA
jgi:hypothetical protein